MTLLPTILPGGLRFRRARESRRVQRVHAIAVPAVHRGPLLPLTPLFTNGREAGRREAASALDSEC